MKELESKIKSFLKKAQKINPGSKLSDSKLNNLTKELLDSIHMSYDPIKVLQDMIKTDKKVYDSWKEAISVSFKNLIIFDQAIEETPVIVLDQSRIEVLSNQAASNFINIFSGIAEVEDIISKN